MNQLDMSHQIFKVNYTTFLRVILGVILFSELVVLYTNHFFSLSGFQSSISNLIDANAWQIVKCLNTIILDMSRFAVYICPVFLLMTSIALLIGIYPRLTSAVSLLIFLIYFMSHTGYQGLWAFTYLMPLLLNVILFINYMSHKHKKQIILPDFYFIHPIPFLIIIVSLGLSVFVAIFLSKNSLSPFFAALISGIVPSIILFIKYLIFFNKTSWDFNDLHLEQKTKDLSLILVGLMLCFQVHENDLLNWFTPDGFSKLITSFQNQSSLPQAILINLNFFKENSVLFSSAQSVIENFIALCLVALLFRPIITIAATLLCLALTIIEFGAAAGYQVSNPNDYTWAYELFLTTFILFVLSFYEIKRSLNVKCIINKLCGGPVLEYKSWLPRIILTLITTVIFTIVIYLMHNVPNSLPELTIRSGLTIFLYLIIFNLFDLAKVILRNRQKGI